MAVKGFRTVSVDIYHSDNFEKEIPNRSFRTVSVDIYQIKRKKIVYR